MSDTEARTPPEDSASEDHWSKPITALIVAATLAAAFVGYLLTAASRSGDAAGLEAERLGSRAMTTLLETQQQAQVGYETFIKAEEQRGRAANVLQSSLFAGTAQGQQLKLAAERWNQLAAQTQRGTTLTADGVDGPQQDSQFPRRFFANATEEALRYSALQDAANQENSKWEQHTAPYTAILTMFAVSLYLLGFALTMSAAVRRLFSTVGVSLLAVGLVWTAVIWASPVRQDPSGAASQFAQGHIALVTAITQADYVNAAQDLTRAIDLRPTFARAYVERAYARFNAGSPQTSGYPSLTTTDALQGAVDDLSQGVSLGMSDFWILWNLGFDQYLLALHQDVEGHADLGASTLDQSIATTRQAIALDQDEPGLRYNLGLALLADGQVDSARQAYRGAVDKSLAVDDPVRQEGWVAGAITDLQFLSDTLGERRLYLGGQVTGLKAYIVGTVSRKGAPPSEEAESLDLSGVKADLDASGMQLNGLNDGALGGLPVSVQWYYQDPDTPGWGVIPEVSMIRANKGRGITDFSSSLATLHQCLSDGQYRAEIYIGDRVFTTPVAEPPFGGGRALLSPSLNVELCYPSDWSRPSRLEQLRGVVDGVDSGGDPDVRKGVYVFRINLPATATTHSPSAKLTVNLTKGAVARFSDLFPGLETKHPTFYGTNKINFMSSLPKVVALGYSYNHTKGLVVVAAGIGPDHGLIMGALFGPWAFVSRAFATGNNNIFDSTGFFDTKGLGA